jgi:hypothetical protein
MCRQLAGRRGESGACLVQLRWVGLMAGCVVGSLASWCATGVVWACGRVKHRRGALSRAARFQGMDNGEGELNGGKRSKDKGGGKEICKGLRPC